MYLCLVMQCRKAEFSELSPPTTPRLCTWNPSHSLAFIISLSPSPLSPRIMISSECSCGRRTLHPSRRKEKASGDRRAALRRRGHDLSSLKFGGVRARGGACLRVPWRGLRGCDGERGTLLQAPPTSPPLIGRGDPSRAAHRALPLGERPSRASSLGRAQVREGVERPAPRPAIPHCRSRGGERASPPLQSLLGSHLELLCALQKCLSSLLSSSPVEDPHCVEDVRHHRDRRRRRGLLQQHE